MVLLKTYNFRKGLSRLTNAEANGAKLPIRLLNFLVNGTQCQNCGLIGEFWELHRDKKDPNSKPKLNLYAYNHSARKGKKKVLFTRDHIIPESLGGNGSLDNSMVLCYPCNNAKADKICYSNIVSKKVCWDDIKELDTIAG